MNVIRHSAEAVEGALSSQAEAPVSELYGDLWPRLVRLGHLLTGSLPDGEDVAQEAYLGLLRAWPVDHPEAYARRSVTNLAINLGRRRERPLPSSPDTDPSVDGGVEAVDGLWPLVQRLPPRQRAVIVLRYYLDLSEADTAEAMGCRPGTVKAHAHHALSRLRKEMQ